MIYHYHLSLPITVPKSKSWQAFPSDPHLFSFALFLLLPKCTQLAPSKGLWSGDPSTSLSSVTLIISSYYAPSPAPTPRCLPMPPNFFDCFSLHLTFLGKSHPLTPLLLPQADEPGWRQPANCIVSLFIYDHKPPDRLWALQSPLCFCPHLTGSWWLGLFHWEKGSNWEVVSLFPHAKPASLPAL